MLGDDLIVKTTKHEQFVLDPWATDGETGELILQAGWMLQMVSNCFSKLVIEFRMELLSVP